MGSWLTIVGSILNINAGLANVGNNYLIVTAIDTKGAFFNQNFNIFINGAPYVN